MPVHTLIEATARPGRLEDAVDAARTFVDAVRDREAHTDTVDAYTIDGARTLLVHLVFDDPLAAEDHRSTKHTHAFTEALDEACEAIDVHELTPVEA